MRIERIDDVSECTNGEILFYRFYYPHGKPISHHEQATIFKNIEDVFRLLPNMHATKEQFSSVTKVSADSERGSIL